MEYLRKSCCHQFAIYGYVRYFSYLVAERKLHFSLSQRGRVRVGVNDISGLSFPPPAPPAGRGVFVQALSNNLIKSALPTTSLPKQENNHAT